MDRKHFAICAALICAVMGAVVGYGVSEGNALLPAIAFIIGIVLIALGKRGVKEVMEDERTNRISEKASRRICQIFAMSAALIGTTLIAMRMSDLSGPGQTSAVAFGNPRPSLCSWNITADKRLTFGSPNNHEVVTTEQEKKEG